MEHLLLKATTTAATDRGEFTAVISAASVDREKDIVSPDGMVRALQKWAKLGKRITLAWNHSTRPEDQIGYVDPASAKAVDGEVVVSGRVDLGSETGREAWRSFKAGTVGFSFGYLIPDGGATKRAGGGRNINELDVFEITATPTPMNNDTRVLAWKSAPTRSSRPAPSSDQLHAQAKRAGVDLPMSARELRERAREIELDHLSGQTAAERTAAAKQANRHEQELRKANRSTRRHADRLALEIAVGDNELLDASDGSHAIDAKSLREQHRAESYRVTIAALGASTSCTDPGTRT